MQRFLTRLAPVGLFEHGHTHSMSFLQGGWTHPCRARLPQAEVRHKALVRLLQAQVHSLVLTMHRLSSQRRRAVLSRVRARTGPRCRRQAVRGAVPRRSVPHGGPGG